ncbi:MAG: MoaD/ThiS family protein [Candidatus Dadabacteria bacterium]|nr:MAG: MoaD/ThiS family protein [Candidatus Dadabacteria bacterium]
MAVSIRIPTPLRKFTDDQDVVEVEGNTVRECIDALIAKHGELANQILDQNGDVRRFVNLFLNDRDVRFSGGDSAEVKDGDEIAIIPAIAGGR